MANKTNLEESLLRSIKFDEEYLNKLDDFLKSNFLKVVYDLKSNRRSPGKKVDKESLLKFIKEITDERVEYIEVYAYKRETDNLGYNSEDLYIRFKKGNILPTIVYKYKDGHENSDIGLLNKLNKILKASRFGYAFLFDDGIISSSGKYTLNLIIRLGVVYCIIYLLYWKNLNSLYGWEFLEFFWIFASIFYIISRVFKFFFPRLVFILTEKEKNVRSKYDLIRKVLFWLGGGLFLIILGIVIERYLLK